MHKNPALRVIDAISLNFGATALKICMRDEKIPINLNLYSN